MTRGRSNWVIEVSSGELGETDIFGPYTKAQAIATVKRMERFFARQAKAMDQDKPDESVICYPLSRWKPGPMLSAPTRPNCPYCGRKLDIWTEDYGEGATHGHCNNPDCEECSNLDFSLTEVDGKWVIEDQEA